MAECKSNSFVDIYAYARYGAAMMPGMSIQKKKKKKKRLSVPFGLIFFLFLWILLQKQLANWCKVRKMNDYSISILLRR